MLARATASEIGTCMPSRRKGTPQIMSNTVVGRNSSPAITPHSQLCGLDSTVLYGASMVIQDVDCAGALS